MSFRNLYLIGISRRRENGQITIITLNSDMQVPTIGISFGWSPHDESTVDTAKFWLEFRPSKWQVKDGKYVEIVAPPGWFGRRCKEARCEWFLPFAERLARNEVIMSGEIEIAYQNAHNGKAIPQGSFGALRKMAHDLNLYN